MPSRHVVVETPGAFAHRAAAWLAETMADVLAAPRGPAARRTRRAGARHGRRWAYSLTVPRLARAGGARASGGRRGWPEPAAAPDDDHAARNRRGAARAGPRHREGKSGGRRPGGG